VDCAAERGRKMRIGNADESMVKANYGKERVEKEAGKEQQENGKNSASIQASELNLFQDGIADKKKKAMQDAMDFVKKQFESDSEVDAVMDECRDEIVKGKEQSLEASRELKSIQEQKEQLKEEFPDGGEEYDAYMKDLKEMEGHWKGELENGKLMVSDSTAAIRSIKQESLKHHGMVDATKAAEETMKNASKEIVGMLMNESKENVDEKIEETVEKAEEAKEEKTEQEEEMKESQLEREKEVQEVEERLEELRKQRERRAAGQAALNAIKNRPFVEEMSKKQMEILENTQQILETQSLLPEEIKGIVVDCNL